MLKASLFFPLAFLVFTSSCTHPNESELPLLSEGFGTPIVTGLRVTVPFGPEPIVIWGSPSDPDCKSSGSSPYMETPYPNPLDGACSIFFALPQQAKISLWIVPARWVGEENTDTFSTGGAVVPSSRAVSVAELIRDRSMSAGAYRLNWDGLDKTNKPLPGGFYRIYFRAGETLCWHDVLLFRSYDEVPKDLLKIIRPDL